MNRATIHAARILRRSQDPAEPLWPPLVAMLAVGGLYAALPPSLMAGSPPWLIIGVVALMLAAILVSHRGGSPAVAHFLGYVLNSIVTAALVVAVISLIAQVTAHDITPQRLLRAAAALWISNILVFASWYWRVDGGGPHQRALTLGHSDGAFLFPQMTMHPEAKVAAGEEEWQPHFVDYLFLAFNTSTAFSPTDVPVLSRWAKAVMMCQSMISLLVIALLAGRAVNIL